MPVTVYDELIQSGSFKEWFGDWQNHPLDPVDPQRLEYAQNYVPADGSRSSVSRMRETVTGQPMIVYHGTARDFDVFDPKAPRAHDRGYYGEGIYFTFGWGKASAGEATYYGHRIVQALLNTRQPFSLRSLSLFGGFPVTRLGGQSLAFLYNIVKSFPEIADEVFQSIGLRGRDGIEITSEFLVSLVDSIPPKLRVVPVRDRDQVMPYIFLETEQSRSSHHLGWRVGSIQPQEEEAHALAVAVFTVTQQYHGICPELFPEGIMTRNPSITQAIRARGYDAIIQSESGDEVAVFDPSQIWIVK
jgi:hypothetical protein